MANTAQMKKIFKAMKVIRPPKYRLSTFGSTHISYCLITDVTGYPDRSRLRTGTVRADQPAILTPDSFKNRFDGFGKDAQAYADFFISQYGLALRGLEYQFKNEPESSRVELSSPEDLAKKYSRKFDSDQEFRSVLLKGLDKMWEISIMKFIVEETLASFSSNVKELQERGFFDSERHDRRRRREVQHLIKRAQSEPSLIPHLGKKLKDYGLFDEFQDDFFRLVH